MENEIRLSRRERKKKDRKYGIICAARNQFQRRGINNVSVNEIAEAADISYATFFNYFSSKDDLYTAIYNEETEDLFEYNAISEKDGMCAAERIESVFVQWWQDATPFKIISLRVTEKYVCDQQQAGAEPNRSLLTLFEGMIQSGVAAGEFAPDTDVTMEALTIMGLFYAGQVCNAALDILCRKVRQEIAQMQRK